MTASDSRREKDKKDIILLMEGGAMRGVFGAGVVTAFQEANIYPRVHSIYASSAGAHNAAFFLSHQTRLGSSIYYEDLAGRSFIHRRRFAALLVHLVAGLMRCTSGKKKQADVVEDLDYLAHVEEKVKRLDHKRLTRSAIPLHVQVCDARTGKTRYLDGRRQTIQILMASSDIIPLYPRAVRVGKGQYIDPVMVGEKLPYEEIARKHHDKTIVAIVNEPVRKGAIVSELSELIMLAILFLWNAKLAVWRARALMRHLAQRKARKRENVLYTVNEKPYGALCTDKKKLMETYQRGIRKGKKVLRALGKTRGGLSRKAAKSI